MLEFLLKFFTLGKETFIYALSGFIIAIFVTPLYFLKTQRQSTGSSYYEICNLIKVNSNGVNFNFIRVFFSGVFYIAILNAYASGIFGFIEGLSIPFLSSNLNLDPYSFSGILIRTLFLGLAESSINIYFDYKAILREKIAFQGKENYLGTNFIKFSFLAFLKNTIGWLSTTLSIFVIYKINHSLNLEISYFKSTILSFIIALFMSTLLLPIDVACVQSVGIGKNKRIFNVLINLFRTNGFKRLCYGGIMRIIIMSIFAAGTVLIDLLLKG